MNLMQKFQNLLVIRQVAEQQGITYDQCYTEISTAIDEAWATTDPEVKRRQIELTGSTRKPTPEEFILLISEKLHKST